MSWTQEDKDKLAARQAAEDKIEKAARKILHRRFRKTVRSQTIDSFKSYMRRAPDIELWAMHDLFTTADSDSLTNGLRYALGISGAKALSRSFQAPIPIVDDPGDDALFAGAQAGNVIYADQAEADTSWILNTPPASDIDLEFQLCVMNYRDAEAPQIINVTRAEYRRLKKKLARMRGLEPPTEPAKTA